MVCPVCGGSNATTVNVRMAQESDLRQMVGSAWDARNVSRCDDCGVIYDHEIASDNAGANADASGEDGAGRVNCPECGALNPATSDDCATCGASTK